MKAYRIHRYVRSAFVHALLVLTGCARAPSFDILGSFFPAWIICFAVAILLTVASRAMLSRYVEIAWPALVYPSMTALFTFAMWLILFH